MDLPALLESLHDATLQGVQLDWKTGTATLLLTPVRPASARRQRLLLRVEDVRELTCPRAHPWGPSVHINKASVFRTVESRERLELEMQSGDVLLVEGRSISAVPIDET